MPFGRVVQVVSFEEQVLQLGTRALPGPLERERATDLRDLHLLKEFLGKTIRSAESLEILQLTALWKEDRD